MFEPKVHTFSVMIIFTQFLPVTGKLHLERILWAPSLALCSITMMTLVPGAETKSIAPPIPFTSLPCTFFGCCFPFNKCEVVCKNKIIHLPESSNWTNHHIVTPPLLQVHSQLCDHLESWQNFHRHRNKRHPVKR